MSDCAGGGAQSYALERRLARLGKLLDRDGACPGHRFLLLGPELTRLFVPALKLSLGSWADGGFPSQVGFRFSVVPQARTGRRVVPPQLQPRRHAEVQPQRRAVPRQCSGCTLGYRQRTIFALHQQFSHQSWLKQTPVGSNRRYSDTVVKMVDFGRQTIVISTIVMGRVRRAATHWPGCSGPADPCTAPGEGKADESRRGPAGLPRWLEANPSGEIAAV